MTAADRSTLAYHDEGLTTGARLVLVHGFTQTSRCWGPFGDALGERHRLRLVDAPGHGASSHPNAELPEAARLLGATGGRGVYIGYSMGGRMALRLALDAPELVNRLVLISASPGIADPTARAVRHEHDDALAERLEKIGVAAFVDEWLAQPMFARLSAAAARRDERLRNTASGLAASLRAVGTGAQDSLWDRLHELTLPVLVVVGADDHKFVAIAHEMCARIGANTEVASIDEAGHTAHLEQPGRTVDAVLDWLRRTR